MPGDVVVLSLLLFMEAAQQEGHGVKQQRAYNSRQLAASDRGPGTWDACRAFSEAAGLQRSDLPTPLLPGSLKQGTCNLFGVWAQDRETVPWTDSIAAGARRDAALQH